MKRERVRPAGGPIRLARLIGVRKCEWGDVPGISYHDHLDHGEVWIRDRQVVALTAHVYDFDSLTKRELGRVCKRNGIALEIIPPPDGWYGEGTTMIIYRPTKRLAVKMRKADGQ